MVELSGLKYQWNFDVSLFFGDSQSIGCLMQNQLLIKFFDNTILDLPRMAIPIGQLVRYRLKLITTSMHEPLMLTWLLVHCCNVSHPVTGCRSMSVDQAALSRQKSFNATFGQESSK